ncbi:hypothetical protein KR018_002264 [Drosophila ironensis]|nr:hypothetical protein KR018_002264 [Drosophila ironensis]
MRSSMWPLLFLCTCLVNLCGKEKSQSTKEESHSTSVAGMVKLLDLERQLIDNLVEYAAELDNKLQKVRRSIASLHSENQKARSSVEEYLANPLNAFSLIRRMNRDWLTWQMYMEDPVGLKQVEVIETLRPQMPTRTDLEEAVTAVDRIQSTYGLKVADIAIGYLNGKDYNVSLTALDTFAIGQVLIDQGNLMKAASWIYQAITWLDAYSLPEPLILSKTDVLSIYAQTLIQLGRNTDALKVVDIALTDKPNDSKLLMKKSEIEMLIRAGTTIGTPQSKTQTPVDAYEQGCRNQYPVSTDARLHCRYKRTTSPFLILAPLRMELLNLDPYMVLFHDVLSSAEISEMQDMATPGLKRATVYSVSNSRGMVAKYRTSKTCSFRYSYNPLTLRLNARIADMTGFDIPGSDMLQIINYGIGGHYSLHYDFCNSVSIRLSFYGHYNKFDILQDSGINGDRIATVLFYLTDVEQGGATAFPNIQKVVFPQRGAAVMWYNLLDDGTPDKRTLHAACPVIVGSKWVSTKWIRERAQLHTRPCLKKSL